MDPTNSFLGRMILEEMTPIVMVLSTPLAEYACQKNGLNFVEMLLPFSNFNKLDVPVRTASDQPYRLQMFKLRLVYASDVRQQNYEAAEEQLKQVVSSASEATLSDLQSDPPQPETVLRKSESDYQPSWIQTFNKELIRNLSFSEHEAFDHPVACLLVVSSKDEQPINRFDDLFNTDRLPSLLNEGAMDPKILKHYLLLHDNQDGTSEKAASILAEMRSTFGSSECKLLCINSVQDANDVGKDNPWVHYKIHASLSQDITCLLNADDLHWIKEFMQDLSSKHIIPHMEQKIRVLNQQVSATRKGFRNQIRNLWWRKGKEDPPEAPSGSTYTFGSIESQIRVLGDYAFMLRDYELALSNYRLLSTDYKLDKAWKHHAGVQEMMGLSFFMLDQSRKDSEYCMETAFTTYLKLGASGQRNATRCGLWWAEMLKARGQYKDAANIYFRISNEEPSLHAAVMLEQASCCYLFTDPPMLRKYAFHLVLAGNRYYVSHQREHAIRMYKSALSIYKGNAWNIINDHVHFNVGRWYAVLGIYDVAVKHMLEVLACSHQSLPTQDLFLRDVFHIVENMGKTFEINKLQLPVIDMSSLKVIYEDHRTYASSSDGNVSESLWQSLEEEMVPLIPDARSNWLESHSKISPSKKPNNSQICVVGEAIRLDIELKNPLQISISISSMSLICELSVKSEETNLVHDADKNISPSGRQDDVELGETPSFRDLSFASSSFTLSEPDLVLGGGETKRIQLDVTPNVEGILKIIGVKWKLSRFVVGYHYFEFDMKKKQRRRKKGAKHSSSSGLGFIVIKGLPKLEGCIHHIPRKAYAGDLRLLTLELRNQSEYTVKNMKMKISHPRFLIPGNCGDLNMDFPSCLGKQISSDSKDVPANIMDSSESLLFLFPNGTTILGGSTFVWPLWFHSALSGNASLYISIYYEMENCSSDMIYRTLRMHYDVEVVPSLDLSFLITPCPSRLQEFLVRMDIVNRTISESFTLQQLSCASNQWEISSLPACGSICPSPMLLAGQALSCFFKIKDTLGSSNNENPLMVQGSDVPLGSQGSTDVLIDVSRSPLAEFQHHERYHQGKSAEGSSITVDFILISKMLGNDPNLELEVHPKLLSNHACHCSITSKSPIWWLMDGPRAITHDFSTSFCEASFHVTIRNCSKDVVSIRISTLDSALDVNLLSDTIQSSDSVGNRGGWHDISLLNEIKVTSDVQGVRTKKSALSQGISPFIWCASSSTQLKLGPACSEEVCMRICVFSPGTYDLSNYEVHWKVLPSDDEVTNDAKRLPSGISKGYPFYVNVLQSSC